ncbi:unnamed protein product, partial [Allacma fusca]
MVPASHGPRCDAALLELACDPSSCGGAAVMLSGFF